MAFKILTAGEVGKGANAELVQARFGNLANSRHLANSKTSEHACFMPRMDEQHAIGLRQIGSDLGNHASRPDPDRAVEIEFVADGVVQALSGFQWWTEQAGSARHIEVGFVN